MARKVGQGKEEEESRVRQQEEKTPVREEEEKPACHGGAHHVVEQARPEHRNVDKAEENDLKKSLMKMLEEAFEEKMKN
ncbi:hypothetical protein STEG23_013200, partial [Scotinomys teguina]